MNFVVEARNIKKKFNERLAVAGVSFEIKKGECFGLLGPNGAGKTTLLRILSGLTILSEGELFVLGLSQKESLQEIKNRIGVVPQGDNLDLELSVEENLLIFCGYFGFSKEEAMSRSHQLLRDVGMGDRFHQSTESLSGGYKKRLALVRALLNDPELIILDEPTVALDPQARLWTWNFLKNQKNLGNSIVLTTHYMEEAEAICDRVALMNEGEILEIGSPQDLIQKHWGQEVLELLPSPSEVHYYLDRAKENKYEFQVFENRILVRLNPEKDHVEIFKKFDGLTMSIRPANLNDVFLKVTGSDLQQAWAQDEASI